MSSASLIRWMTDGASELDQMESAHAALGGKRRGRRWTTQQINYSYAMLLSSQFQRFCRDLHSECTDHLVSSVVPATLTTILRVQFTRDRKLDRGNANPGNLGSDFGRFGIDFWTDVASHKLGNRARQAMLEELNTWRNAIVHHDFRPNLKPPRLTLPVVRRWRRSCDALADSFDDVMRIYIHRMVGAHPW